MGAGETAEGRRGRSQGVIPVRRPLLLRQVWGQDLSWRLGVPLRAPVSQQRGGGRGAVHPVPETRVVVLVEAVGGTAAQSVASHAAPLAAAGRAVAVRGRVDVGVVQRRRVVAVVQRDGVLRCFSGGGVAFQRGVAAQDGVFGPRLVHRGAC